MKCYSASWLLEWAAWVYRVCMQVPVYSLYVWQTSGDPAQAGCLGCWYCRVMMEHTVDVDRYCSEVISLRLS